MSESFMYLDELSHASHTWLFARHSGPGSLHYKAWALSDVIAWG